MHIVGLCYATTGKLTSFLLRLGERGLESRGTTRVVTSINWRRYVHLRCKLYSLVMSKDPFFPQRMLLSFRDTLFGGAPGLSGGAMQLEYEATRLVHRLMPQFQEQVTANLEAICNISTSLESTVSRRLLQIL